MRLVDADALLTEVRECKVMQRSENTDYRTGYISAMSTVEGIIADELLKLTIDAIPVEWLNKQCEMADDRGDMEMTDAISWLIQTWHEEQEAQDG